VQAGTAEVILLSDAEHAIPVQSKRSGLRTIAVGTGDSGKLSLPFVTVDSDLKTGDLLLTTGMGGVFPPGYPVAEVTRVERNPAATFALVDARPTARLDRAREVLLVWFEPPAATTPATSETAAAAGATTPTAASGTGTAAGASTPTADSAAGAARTPATPAQPTATPARPSATAPAGTQPSTQPATAPRAAVSTTPAPARENPPAPTGVATPAAANNGAAGAPDDGNIGTTNVGNAGATRDAPPETPGDDRPPGANGQPADAVPRPDALPDATREEPPRATPQPEPGEAR
jgi:rod shape-determining protein MreC